MSIRVICATQQAGLGHYGGAETQILRTVEHLNALREGIAAKLYNMWEDRVEDYDILHIFNPGTFPLEALSLAKLAHGRKTKVAVSPIFYDSYDWTRTELGRKSATAWKAAVSVRQALSRSPLLELLDPYRFVGKLLALADAILPNTTEEKRRLLAVFPEAGDRSLSVVPNGVETRFKRGDPHEFQEKTGLADFVLFVGRIDRRKNVLGLVRAYLKADIDGKLVIVGDARDAGYLESCRRAADSNVVFLPPIPHDSTLLMSAYKAAKVVALPSYFETPGLTALEGGLAGANIVVTEVGGAREYLGPYAWYVNPANQSSMVRAIRTAYTTPRSEALSRHLEQHFSWEVAARMTAEAYAQCLRH